MSYSAEEMSPERASHEYFETCCVCDDEFSSDGELTNHLVGHAEEEPYRTKLLEFEKTTTGAPKSLNQAQKRSFTQRSASPEVWEIVSDDSDDESSKSKAAKTSSNFRLVSGNKPPAIAANKPTAFAANKLPAVAANKLPAVAANKLPAVAAGNSSTPKAQNTYNCSTCKAVFKDSNSYREHLLTHGQQTYACQICKKKFPNKAVLRQHLHLHISEKQYECKTCNKKFSMKEMLVKHEAEHRIEQRRIEPVVTRSKLPPSKKP